LKRALVRRGKVSLSLKNILKAQCFTKFLDYWIAIGSVELKVVT
jgi:hypothetical protein